MTVNELVEMLATVSGKTVTRNHIPGPVGVLGRYQTVDKIKSLGWESKFSMVKGMEATYKWVEEQVNGIF